MKTFVYPKRIFGLALSLVMVAALLPVFGLNAYADNQDTSEASNMILAVTDLPAADSYQNDADDTATQSSVNKKDTEEQNTTDDNSSFLLSHIHNDRLVSDKAIRSEKQLNTLFSEGGSGVLAADINLNNTVAVSAGKTVDLCLNGYVIDGQQKLGSVITVPSGATLNIYDCNETTMRYFTDSDGDGCFYDCARTMPDGTEGEDYLTIIGGVITGGTEKGNKAGVYGGAISNRGIVNIHGGTLIGNYASNGGAIHNGGTCTLNNDAALKGNAAATYGGGVYNYAYGTSAKFMLNENAEISYNSAGYSGAFDNSKNAKLIMNDSARLNHNQASEHYGAMRNAGTVEMNDKAAISHNRSKCEIVSNSFNLTMNNETTISENTVINEHNDSTVEGCVSNSGKKCSFTMNDSASVKDNTASSKKSGLVIGAGVHSCSEDGNSSSFVMNDNAFVTGNTAESARGLAVGGGVYCDGNGGSMKLNDNATITGNTVKGKDDERAVKSNLHLKESLLTVDSAFAGLLGVSTDADISHEKPYVFMNKAAKSLTDKITSDKDSYLVTHENNKLKLASRVGE